MNIVNFEQQIEVAQHNLEVLAQQSAGSSKPVLETIAALSMTIEELHGAIEELYTKNQELMVTRQALETERQRYQDLFDEAPDSYFETDNKGTIQRANRAAAFLLSVPQPYLIGKPLVIFVADSDRSAFYRQILALRQQKHILGWEISMQPRGAQPISVEISVSTKHERQQIQGWRWIVRDLSQRQQVEEARAQLETQTKLNEFKTNLLNSISHEFRTPLNIISMSSSTIERFLPILNEEQREQISRRMRLAVKCIIQLLEELEFFHEAERLNYSSTTLIELEPFCHNLIADLQELLGAKHSVNLEVRNSRTVCLNVKLLQQILRNLLSNSLRYSSEESLIGVIVICGDDSVKFQIQDSGIGIPKEDQTNIFQPFYRGRNAQQAQTISGIGLGLATVKKAVDYGGGEIVFTSEEGVGSSFTVTLPLKSTVQ